MSQNEQNSGKTSKLRVAFGIHIEEGNAEDQWVYFHTLDHGVRFSTLVDAISNVRWGISAVRSELEAQGSGVIVEAQFHVVWNRVPFEMDDLHVEARRKRRTDLERLVGIDARRVAEVEL